MTRDKSPRLKDVAHQAGVSPSTASMVFSGTGRISDATRERVLKAAGVLKYRHPLRAKLSNVRSPVVGILVSTDNDWSFVWHFLVDMIRRMETDAENIGLRTVLIPITHGEEDEKTYRKISELGCRSIFSIHIGRESLFDRLEKTGIPVILIMNNNYQDRFFSICVDDFQGAYEGTRHLLQLGHRRIDFVDSSREDLPLLSSDRYYGYRKALEEGGIVVTDDHRLSCLDGCTMEDLQEQFRTALGRKSPFTALFCLDDEIAFRAWNALERIGCAVPADISILAPGDLLDYDKPYIPAITTMQIDMDYVGRLAVQMLANRLNDNIGSVHVLKVKQQLVNRGSCRAMSDGGHARDERKE